jgi:DNA-binding transcriptional MocR family regulator
MALGDAEPLRDRAIDPFWVSPQSLDADPAAVKRGCGWLPADWRPNSLLRRGLRKLTRAEDAVLVDYGSTRGSPMLRRLLLARLAEERIVASPNQLMLTVSSTQAIDMICRFLLKRGDTVLVDDPCYFNFRALLGRTQSGSSVSPTRLRGPT